LKSLLYKNAPPETVAEVACATVPPLFVAEMLIACPVTGAA